MLSTLILVVWGACALAGAVISQNRGNSAAAGFFGALIFGVFGLLMAATTARNPTAKETRCLACEEIKQKHAVICPHCRSTNDEATALKELHWPKAGSKAG